MTTFPPFGPAVPWSVASTRDEAPALAGAEGFKGQAQRMNFKFTIPCMCRQRGAACIACRRWLRIWRRVAARRAAERVTA